MPNYLGQSSIRKVQIIYIKWDGVGTEYEESVVDKFKSNLLLIIFWLHIINYNS